MRAKKLKRNIHRIAAVAAVLVLAFGICGCGVTEELNAGNQTGTVAEGTCVYVSLGDNIASGTGSYAAKFSDYLYSIFIEDNIPVNTHDMAVSGATTGDLLELLGSNEELAKLKDADYVTVSIGINDILEPIQAVINEALDTKLGPGFGKYMSENADVIDEEFLKSLSDTLSGSRNSFDDAFKQYKENMEAIISQISESAPNAVIVVNNYYNPYKDVKVIREEPGNEAVIFNVGPITAPYVQAMNTFVAELVGKYAGGDLKIKLADISGLGEGMTNVSFNGDLYDPANTYDPNPNASGHEEICRRIVAAIS